MYSVYVLLIVYLLKKNQKLCNNNILTKENTNSKSEFIPIL